MLTFLRENLEGLHEETLADFCEKNRERHPIEPGLNPGGVLICVGDTEFGRIFRGADGWDRFREAFPTSDGTLRVSRVGFDRVLTQALVYAGQQFDFSTGSSGFWLFSRFGGEWVEAGRAGSGVS